MDGFSYILGCFVHDLYASIVSILRWQPHDGFVVKRTYPIYSEAEIIDYKIIDYTFISIIVFISDNDSMWAKQACKIF